jgi:hypothetical protein
MQGTPTSTYTFAPSTQNTGSNCSGGTTQDMLRTFSAGTDATQTAGTTTFCSDPFSSGSTVESGGTATAYFANSGTSSCTVKATLSKDGSTGSSTSTQTIPSSSSTKAYTFSFTDNGVQTMDAGDRLNLSFDATASGCSSTVLHYGSSSTLGQFQTPTMQVWAPTAPASVTVTPQSDGTAIITWPQSSGGAPVSFYRIYRDGGDYQDRYSILTTDNCLNGTCTFTDTRRSGSHSYYITAVGSTTPGANMAESPPVGPASG